MTIKDPRSSKNMDPYIYKVNIKKNMTVRMSKQEYYITLPKLKIWVEATQFLATNLNQIRAGCNK